MNCDSQISNLVTILQNSENNEFLGHLKANMLAGETCLHSKEVL